MSSSSFFKVKDNFARPHESSREDVKAKEDRLLDVLAEIEDDLENPESDSEMNPALLAQGEMEESDEDEEHDTVNLARLVLMTTRTEMDKPNLGRLLRLYRGDQLLVDEVLPILENDESDLLAEPYLQNLPRSALRELLMESTDDFSTSLGLAAKPGFRILGGLGQLTREADKILQEFFDICREPNLAEIDMLAQACRVPAGIVSQYFTLKHTATQRLFVMQGLATKGSELGTKLRKHEYLRNGGPRLRSEPPPEFSDPDIYEGWWDESKTDTILSLPKSSLKSWDNIPWLNKGDQIS